LAVPSTCAKYGSFPSSTRATATPAARLAVSHDSVSSGLAVTMLATSSGAPRTALSSEAKKTGVPCVKLPKP